MEEADQELEWLLGGEILEADHARVGQNHVIAFRRVGITFDVSRLDIGKEIHAWVKVTSSLPGTPTLLTDQRYNLSGPRGRADMIRYLGQRAPDVGDWAEVVERMIFKLLEVVRQGEPVVGIQDVGPRPEVLYRAHPIALNGLPVVLFGEGGCGKTTLASTIALAVHSGENLCGLTVTQGAVLYLDWETDEYTVSERMKMLARAAGITDYNVRYRACYAPLYEEAQSIGPYIANEGISLVIVDSLGAACGGDKNSQEITNRMFEAMRSWRCGVLAIDHEAKDQAERPRGKPTPYGSVYTVNMARSVWRVRGTQEENDNTLHVGLFQTKSNIDRRQAPLGFRFVFGDGEILAEREDVREVPELRENLTASVRIKLCLLKAKESLTAADIAEGTNLSITVVRSRLTELFRQGVVLKIEIGGQNPVRWAMKSEREGE